jgi:hypothetical protein
MEIAREIHALGVSSLQANNIHGALIHFGKALLMAPDLTEASLFHGYCLDLLGRYEEALSAYDQALAGSPCLVAAWNNRGNTLLKLCRYEQAVESYSRALDLAPGLLDARVALATCFQALGLISEAMSACEAVLEADPGHAEAHWNKALLLLLNGDYRQGWREYEWRWRKRGFTSPLRDFTQPRWHGETFSGRTVLIHAEQGFGDTLQFCRYVPLVAARGGRVVFECHPPLVPLMEGLVIGVSVVAMGQPLPPFDLHVPLMSLPMIFDTTMETIPSAVPYLSPPTGHLLVWRDLVKDKKHLKVGLCWARKSFPDPGRSCPPKALGLLADVKGIEFYSLQVGYREGGMPLLPLIDLCDRIVDFADSAALISCLDLVISVDTAVAHLAGALGKECWILLTIDPDWRWMIDRDDCPWYPSLRLFRQLYRGSWQDVIQRVKSELRDKAASPREN